VAVLGLFFLVPILTYGKKENKPRSFFYIPLGIYVAFIIIVLVIYKNVGFGREISSRLETKKSIASKGIKATMDELLAKLEKKLEQNPDEIKYLHGLSQAYEMAGYKKKAADAYGKLHAKLPDDLRIEGKYLQYLYLSNQRKLSDKAKIIMASVESKQPNNQTVLTIKASDAYSKREFFKAALFWQQLLNATEPRYKKEIEITLQEVLSHLSEKDKNRFTKIVQKNSIVVMVDLPENLKHLVSNSDVLFVFLKRNGQKMPFAAKRTFIASFPVTINITQNDVLGGGILANEKNLVVGAKISSSAQDQSSVLKTKNVAIKNNKTIKLILEN
jgi:cytochrome c-type biogenesis protein CcmH